MALRQWYELRVAGSPGTRSGTAQSLSGGIAIGENGRLCSLSSGRARKFDSEAAAIAYLGKMRIPGDYQFEAVRCGITAAS